MKAALDDFDNCLSKISIYKYGLSKADVDKIEKYLQEREIIQKEENAKFILEILKEKKPDKKTKYNSLAKSIELRARIAIRELNKSC